ncbi:nSTAND1 domain-containing NTPase [Phytohabitans sp. LJ34]|uniref:nSTAND1 domain-containing NTPase n=1 Tax=Phytohabitans sp. LJ34 TaxID=3452217 RepID=UPI003F8C5B90
MGEWCHRLRGDRPVRDEVVECLGEVARGGCLVHRPPLGPAAGGGPDPWRKGPRRRRRRSTAAAPAPPRWGCAASWSCPAPAAPASRRCCGPGLIPRLGAASARPAWQPVLMTAGRRPASELAWRMGEIAARTPHEVALAVVVDQFEELFTRGADDAEQAEFLARLRALVRASAGCKSPTNGRGVRGWLSLVRPRRADTERRDGGA